MIIAQIRPILLHVFIAFQDAALSFLRHNFRHRVEENFYLIPTSQLMTVYIVKFTILCEMCQNIVVNPHAFRKLIHYTLNMATFITRVQLKSSSNWL
jgi:hypothetical protein